MSSVAHFLKDVLAQNRVKLASDARISNAGSAAHQGVKTASAQPAQQPRNSPQRDPMKVAQALFFAAENLGQLIDNRSPQEKVAEHFAFEQALRAKHANDLADTQPATRANADSIPPMDPSVTEDGQLETFTSSAEGKPLNPNESGAANHQPPKVTNPSESGSAPNVARTAMPTDANDPPGGGGGERIERTAPFETSKSAAANISALVKTGAINVKQASALMRKHGGTIADRAKQAQFAGRVKQAMAAGLSLPNARGLVSLQMSKEASMQKTAFPGAGAAIGGLTGAYTGAQNGGGALGGALGGAAGILGGGALQQAAEFGPLFGGIGGYGMGRLGGQLGNFAAGKLRGMGGPSPEELAMLQAQQGQGQDQDPEQDYSQDFGGQMPGAKVASILNSAAGFAARNPHAAAAALGAVPGAALGAAAGGEGGRLRGALAGGAAGAALGAGAMHLPAPKGMSTPLGGRAAVAGLGTIGAAGGVAGGLGSRLLGGKPERTVTASLKHASDIDNPANVHGDKTPLLQTSSDAANAAQSQGRFSEELADSGLMGTDPGRNLISNNMAAINATKKDTKAGPKAELNHYFTEPALSSATDTVLDKTLDNAPAAGVKIAQGLRKWASLSPENAAHLKMAAKMVRAKYAADEGASDKKPEEKKEPPKDKEGDGGEGKKDGPPKAPPGGGGGGGPPPAGPKGPPAGPPQGAPQGAPPQMPPQGPPMGGDAGGGMDPSMMGGGMDPSMMGGDPMGGMSPEEMMLLQQQMQQQQDPAAAYGISPEEMAQADALYAQMQGAQGAGGSPMGGQF